MNKEISINQSDWQRSSFAFLRNNTLSYFIDLHQAVQSCPKIGHKFQNCKYCKSYPFLSKQPPESKNVNQCQLCGSINEYQVCWPQLPLPQQQQTPSKSYLMPLPSNMQNARTLIVYIECFQEEYVSVLIQAFNLIFPSIEAQTTILVRLQNGLGIIDFNGQEAQIIVLTQGLDDGQFIQDKKCKMNSQTVSQLQLILLACVQSNKTTTNNAPLFVFSQIFASNRNKMVLWIGKLSCFMRLVPTSTSLCIVPIVLIQQTIQSANILIDVQRKCPQVHFLQGNNIAIQLYYKLFQVLNQQYIACIIEGILTLRTNKQYSGSLHRAPTTLINRNTQLLEVSTKFNEKHKLQIIFDRLNISGEKLKVIINEQSSVKRVDWFDLLIMMSRALESVLWNFLKLPINQRTMDFYFIRTHLQAFLNLYQNKTKIYEQIILQITNYFKEFQKHPFKIYLPFSQLYRKQLLFLFYPLNQGGIVYHFDGLWSDQEEVNVEWVQQLMGVNWIPRQKKLPIFYQLCLNKDLFSCFEPDL